ncbi:MAG: hypothetical protein QM758_16160 [Armatimonas sp.]
MASDAATQPLSPSALRVYMTAKRLLDFFGALIGLLLLFPLFALLGHAGTDILAGAYLPSAPRAVTPVLYG